MPITRKEFDKGLDDNSERDIEKILKFLENNKDSAFTIDEIHDDATVKVDDGIMEFYMRHLMDSGKVESKRIGVHTYYIAKEERPEPTPEY